MLTFPSNAEVDDFERASYQLAVQLEQAAHDSGQSAAVVVKACCWVLSGLVVQASQDGDASLDEALKVATDTLVFCVAQLAHEATQTVQ